MIAQQIIIEYMPLAKKLAHSFRSLDQEEALGEAFLGLCIAAKEFDETRYPYFGPLARKVILNRLLKMLHEKKNSAHIFNIDLQQVETDEKDESYQEFGVKIELIMLADPHNPFEMFDVVSPFLEWYNELTEEQQIIIELSLHHISQKEIAKAVHTSQPTVQRRLRDLRASLLNYLNREKHASLNP